VIDTKPRHGDDAPAFQLCFQEQPMKITSIRKNFYRAALSVLLAVHVGHASAHTNASDLSLLSALPIAISVAAPVMVLSAGASLTVVAVQASATGTVWVLERASDGARSSVKLSAQAAKGASMVAGTAVLVTAVSTGWVLSVASQVIAFVPNEIGTALLHNEKVTR
jgi:hypothetical protein